MRCLTDDDEHPSEATKPARHRQNAPLRRYSVLAASITIQLCLGGVYAWSVFVTPLRTDYGLSTAQTQLIFGVMFAVFTMVMVFAGRWQENRGPRLVAAAGGLVFGCGYLLASMSGGSYPLILLGVGVIGGAGIGLCYVCPLATCVKWFPQSKGLVTGLAVAGFGGGAILLTMGAGALIERGYNVLEVFRVIGLTYGTVLVACALLLRTPDGCQHQPKQSILLRLILRQSSFWSLALGMFCGTFSGLMVVGNIKPIGVSAGLNPEQADLAVMTFALGNTVGRILWGTIHDKIGRIAIPMSLMVLCLAVDIILPSASSIPTYALAVALAGFGFGACFVVYAAQAATEFGPNAIGQVYPIIFLAYGLSGVLGPPAGGALFDQTGSYSAAMGAAATITALGIVASSLLSRCRPNHTCNARNFVPD
ncbi:MAG: OFA family MFS transporter [Armatimonadota bacterium]